MTEVLGTTATTSVPDFETQMGVVTADPRWETLSEYMKENVSRGLQRTDAIEDRRSLQKHAVDLMSVDPQSKRGQAAEYRAKARDYFLSWWCRGDASSEAPLRACLAQVDVRYLHAVAERNPAQEFERGRAFQELPIAMELVELALVPKDLAAGKTKS